jgi:CHASE3 domain sensor protein
MDIQSIWSTVLTLFIGLLVFVMREKFEELSRLSILLNKTREEVARDYITQAEVQRITDHIDQRFNRLEAKIDELIRQKG